LVSVGFGFPITVFFSLYVKTTMDESNNARRHHHGGGGTAEVVAGGNTGGGGGATNGLSLSLPLPLTMPGSSSAKLSASPPPPPPPPPQPAGEPVEGDRVAAPGGRDDIWSQSATLTLIDAWGERYLELNRGNLKQKHWKEVAEAVNGRPGSNKQPKTDVQCKNRLDTLKKKYKVERSKIFAGSTTKWPLFTKMDELIGPARKLHHHHPQPLPLPPPPPMRPRRHPIESSPNPLNTATSPDMTESCLNGFNGNPSSAKRRKTVAVAVDNPDSSPLKELAGAILKFGEVYERTEVVKHQQMIDLEKHRMEFAKDLELQRMQLFVQTQLELAKIKHAKHGNTEHYL
jgi:hypothetical protein